MTFISNKQIFLEEQTVYLKYDLKSTDYIFTAGHKLTVKSAFDDELRADGFIKLEDTDGHVVFLQPHLLSRYCKE